MKPRLVLVLVLAILAAGGGWVWWRAGTQQAAVRPALPPVPDLSAASPALRDAIVAADARARGRFTAVKGLVALSRLYHANGYYDAALACYTGLEKLQPAEPRWLHLHAFIIAGYGELDPAIKMWQRVTQLAPDYVPAHLRLADALLKSNQIAAAGAEYETVLKLSPDNAYARLGLARIDLEAQRWDQAREKLEAIVRQTHFNLGYDLIVSLYERLGLSSEAASIRGSSKASGAYRDFPDPWLSALMDDCFDPYRLGITAGVAAQSGDTAGAKRLLLRAIELAPDDVSSHFQLGGLAVATKDTKLAREQFERCTQIAPTFSDGWAQLSNLQADSGEAIAAAATLKEGLEHCPDSPGLHLLQARRLRDAGSAGEAIQEFKTSIRLRPNEPEAYVELGTLYINLGQDEVGISLMRLAFEADPGDPAALGALAFHAISTGKEAEARDWLTRIANQPRVPGSQAAVLYQAYQQAFGRTFNPKPSGD
ncbi:MAG TPA: tetratricopeptide repeat protein [Lacunisphaera sp.]|jgi:tetratricopeptide (TPR) repeat protein|nr:tetratricopeptide repeat protein [Lacunisphaera sp.]